MHHNPRSRTFAAELAAANDAERQECPMCGWLWGIGLSLPVYGALFVGWLALVAR